MAMRIGGDTGAEAVIRVKRALAPIFGFWAWKKIAFLPSNIGYGNNELKKVTYAGGSTPGSIQTWQMDDLFGLTDFNQSYVYMDDGSSKVALRRRSMGNIVRVDSAFAGRYNWFSFRPGKISQKHQLCSRLYIDFKSPEDVLEFAEFINGHVFVKEKGGQFKTIVEYAPSERVPKNCYKNDGLEGTIFKAIIFNLFSFWLVMMKVDLRRRSMGK
ncbi:Detected protein of unknown function [Hibiscus syriacus]|uniref:UPF3 domain-containing protein n=1 Tax=Hibiscus syriacus TaxID=106335 RepID=A0A6A3CEW6_HIBSY|nr:Detected protein of unknown function [Hibiscus syriacus]